MKRTVYYIDVGKMSMREWERLVEVMSLITKYKLRCPLLMESIADEVKEIEMVEAK